MICLRTSSAIDMNDLGNLMIFFIAYPRAGMILVEEVDSAVSPADSSSISDSTSQAQQQQSWVTKSLDRFFEIL